jgi:hypothetical protein
LAFPVLSTAMLDEEAEWGKAQGKTKSCRMPHWDFDLYHPMPLPGPHRHTHHYLYQHLAQDPWFCLARLFCSTGI